MSVQQRSNVKLGPKYSGPFQILDKNNLHGTTQIHPTIHVSQLKAFMGKLPTKPYIPKWLQGTNPSAQRALNKILARKIVKRGNAAAV